MTTLQESIPESFDLPRPLSHGSTREIPGATHESFVARFGHAFPTPLFLKSALGTTAVYDLPSASGQSTRQVLVVHGLNTPALGLLALARELQNLDPSAHVVLFDLWGHGLSSTPLVAHTPQIFHSQILQVLNFMQWTGADMIGYSFGGSTAISFTLYYPQAVSSISLLAPAGILQKTHFDPGMEDLLDNSTGREAEARSVVLNWLEGGPLKVPDNWQEQADKGIMVAEALREWVLREHPGYPFSVLSIFRDGGCYGCESNFREFAKSSSHNLVVLAEHDIVGSPSQLSDLGFGNVVEVKGHGHALVRTAPGEVAQLVHKYWLSKE